jgi:hypothetical protein
MSKTRVVRIAALGAALAVLAAVPALAAQLDPRDVPQTKGPLDLGGKVCNKQRLKAPNGQVGVVTRACIYAYTFDSSRENDDQRDYGVAWLQTYAEPKNGWCLNRVRSNLINQNDDISAKAPRGRRTFNKGRRFVTTLRSRANGAAEEVGVVKNGFFVRRGTMRSRMGNNGTEFRLIWRGKVKKPVAFALGIEANWAESENFVFAPGGGIKTRLERC